MRKISTCQRPELRGFERVGCLLIISSVACFVDVSEEMRSFNKSICLMDKKESQTLLDVGF